LAQTKVPQELPREQELEPVLQTDIHRTVRVVELPDGTVVEAVYDEGTIAADDAR
jgi:inorganic triphosphatase YgiF